MCKITWNNQIFLELFIYRLFSLKGRANRKEYIIRFCSMITLCVISAYSRFYTDASKSWIILFLDLGFIIIFVIYTIQVFFVTHRRLHDLNASGWWQLITFIPFGQLLMIAFIFFKGTPGPNKYGPPPEY